jgi:hypothetical protein
MERSSVSAIAFGAMAKFDDDWRTYNTSGNLNNIAATTLDFARAAAS